MKNKIKIKKKIKNTLKTIKDDSVKMGSYYPKLYGESKAVSYENDGLVKTFCMTAEWPSGEGFDFSFDTNKSTQQRISLHHDELEAMLCCLEHLGYFSK